MNASVVVCSRNRADSLLATVASVLHAAGELPGEIVVVDQSDRRNDELVGGVGRDACRVRYLPDPGRGVSRARNLGAAAARLPVIVFLDDDIRATDGWLVPLVEPVARDPRVVTCARVLAGHTPPGAIIPSIREDTAAVSFTDRVGIDVLWTCAMAISAATFAETGGFDERLGPGRAFPAAEDNDLGFRLLESGHTIRFVPESAVVHDGARAGADYLALRRDYGVGMGAFYAKHMRPGDLHTAGRLVRDVASHAGRAARYCLRRRRLSTVGDLVYSSAVVVGACRWWLSGRGGAFEGTRAASRRP